MGQSTIISKNGKISKGVRNSVRKKNKNGEKVDRKKRINQLDRVKCF